MVSNYHLFLNCTLLDVEAKENTLDSKFRYICSILLLCVGKREKNKHFYLQEMDHIKWMVRKLAGSVHGELKITVNPFPSAN